MPPACAGRRLPALLLLAIVVASPAMADESGARSVLASRPLVAADVSSPLASRALVASDVSSPLTSRTLVAPDVSWLPSGNADLTPSDVSLDPNATAGAANAATLGAAGVATGRPRALVPLYVSFGALQALDAATTVRALDRGATEANPAIGGIAGNPAALVAVKAASSAAIVFAGERLWRKNRVAAVALMAALNGAYSLVVFHNYRTVR